MSIINNPIIKGFYPDPSICRVEDKFYLVNSTFAYFPAIPIFESENLVNWTQIGNVLDRNDQINFQNIRHSEGIYAPTIRYSGGVFYLICTNIPHGWNFIVKAEKAEGPWSNPYFIEGAKGIDPSLFFDDDGKVYYVGTRTNSKGERYSGDNEIWCQEIDLDKMELIGESHVLWNGAMEHSTWAEGPHLYKKDGYYYLMIAEGGTGMEHSVTIARSKRIFSRYEGNPKNPILTHRHLGRKYPVKKVGHADLIEDNQGNWYMVMLASRSCMGYCNLGRETFLANVIWEDGWPVVNEGIGKLEINHHHPLKATSIKETRKNYDFSTYKQLGFEWLFLRNPTEDLYSLDESRNSLRLYLKDKSLSDLDNPAYICIRQDNFNFTASTCMEFYPSSENEEAGLAMVQSDEYYIKYVVTGDEDSHFINIIKCVQGKEELIEKAVLKNNLISLKIIQKEQELKFYFRDGNENYKLLAEDISSSILSTEYAGGFVGTTIGMYGSSNGKTSNNYVDYMYFKYKSTIE